MGTASAMIALGWTVGPPVGGWLYTIAGYRLPFLLLASLTILSLPPLLMLFPKRPAAVQHAATTNTFGSTAGSESMENNAERAGDVAVMGEMNPQRESWLTMASGLPVDLWIVLLSAFLFMSKWGCESWHFIGRNIDAFFVQPC